MPAWGAPERRRGRGKPGCSGTGGVGTGGDGCSRWDAAQCRWRGFQPARSCPAILQHRAPLARVFCPDLAAGDSPEGIREAAPAVPKPGPAPAALPLGSSALTLPASACYLILSLSPSPPCFLSPPVFPQNGFSASRLGGSGVTAPPAEPAPLPGTAVPSAASARTWQGKSTEKGTQEKMVQKRQNTEMVPGDFNLFPFFCPL